MNSVQLSQKKKLYKIPQLRDVVGWLSWLIGYFKPCNNCLEHKFFLLKYTVVLKMVV